MMMQVPKYNALELGETKARYAVIVCAWNEGNRLHRQLEKMKRNVGSTFDVIIADGPSTDGSTDPKVMNIHGVKAIIQLTESGGLSSALRAAIAYAMEKGHRGIVMMDGNDKDDTSALGVFAKKLDDGFDYIQGSRYMPGGQELNTPRSRRILLKFVHVPFFSLLCARKFTDTTNGFRGISKRLILDERVSMFREVFGEYELPYYLAWAACRYGFRTIEIPVTRGYPATGPIPTKITGMKGYMRMLKPLMMLALRRY